MKLTISFGLLLMTSVALAGPIEVDKGEPLRFILKRATCEIEVLKPLLIFKGKDYTSADYFLIGVKTSENKVRKIAPGRKILISSMDRHFIHFKDKTIDRSCLRKTLEYSDIYCEPLHKTTIGELERLSGEAITVTCKDDIPTEI